MSIKFNNLTSKKIKKNSQAHNVDLQLKPTQKQIESSNLIAEVKKRPYLWWRSKTNPYKTRVNRSIVWNEVIEKLGIESIEEAKRRWEILRDIFRRELKKGNIPNTNEYKSTWYHFEEMMFLAEAVQSKEEYLESISIDLLILEERQEKLEKEQQRQQQEHIQTYKSKNKKQQPLEENRTTEEQNNEQFEQYNAEIKSEHFSSDEEQSVREKNSIIDNETVVKKKKIISLTTTTGETSRINNNKPNINNNLKSNKANNGKHDNDEPILSLHLMEKKNNIQNSTIKCKLINQLTENTIKKRKIAAKQRTLISTPSLTSSEAQQKISEITSLYEESKAKKFKRSIDLTTSPTISQHQQQKNFLPLSVMPENSIFVDGDGDCNIKTGSEPLQNSNNNVESNYDLHTKMIESSDYHFALSLIPFMKTVTDSNKLRMRMRLVQVLLEENLRVEQL